MGVLYDFLLEPMFNLYIHLPYVGWGGRYESQICAQITGIQERHWLLEGSYECSEMINRNFASKITLIRSALQVYLIFSTSSDILFLTRRKILSFFFSRKKDDICQL